MDTGRVLAFLLALLALPPALAHGQSRLTQQEALALAFPAPDSIVRRTAFLSTGEVAKAAALSGPGVEPPPSVLSYYVAWKQGRALGVAYFDTHRVRTERETTYAVRLIARPAPWEQVQNESRLPLPRTMNERAPIEPGMMPSSPSLADTAPLRVTKTSLPKCFSRLT